ncbi:hypothetical protein VSU19_20120 [Verrucomicrobiales bacterium BCK34]|nr:hypothetical protein [Verrucomicrobiales bacterium BCK34]
MKKQQHSYRSFVKAEFPAQTDYTVPGVFSFNTPVTVLAAARIMKSDLTASPVVTAGVWIEWATRPCLAGRAEECRHRLNPVGSWT